MAYDGEGRRVALEVNWSSPAYYIGISGEQTAGTLTKYLPSAPGMPPRARAVRQLEAPG